MREENMQIKKFLCLLFVTIVFNFSLAFILSPLVEAQDNWIALPPYNTLWPLWSPALSPVNPVTGVATPIINNLAPSTVLPVQPALTWDPAWSNPWLLYNTPVGLLFYDPLYGINKWPASYLIDPVTGVPVPITLPVGYPLLAPTDAVWLQTTLPIANASYQAVYPQFAPATSIVPIPSALLALLGLTNLSLPPLPPASTTFLTVVDILGYVPVI